MAAAAPVSGQVAGSLDVLLPARGALPWIDAALHSLATQSLPFATCFIVDDGIEEPDRVLRVARHRLGDRVELLNAPGKGISAALNHAAGVSGATWLARMDADDIAHPQRLARQMAWLETRGETYAACGTQVYLVDARDRRLQRSRYPCSYADIRAARLARTCFAHPTLILRRKALLTVPYRTELDGAEDVDLMLRFGERWLIGNLDEALLEYRIHAGQADAPYRARQTALQELAIRLALQREQHGSDPLDADPALAEAFVDWRLAQPGYAAARQALTAARYALAALRGPSPGTVLHSVRQLLGARPWQAATRRWLWRIAAGSRASPLDDPLPAHLAARLDGTPGATP